MLLIQMKIQHRQEQQHRSKQKQKKQTKKSKTKLKSTQALTKRANSNVKAVPKIKKNIKRLSTEKTNRDAKSKVSKATGLNIANLKKQLAASLDAGGSSSEASDSLRSRMLDKLDAARFRFLNEQMYTSEGAEAQQLFQSDPGAFSTYHQGYRRQVARWPLNPLDTVIAAVRELPRDLLVVDLGCGDARLSRSVPQSVRSFDLVAAAEGVVACDMARVPLKNASADVAVYCLSLMGTNLRDYLLEANRILKIGGVLKIAEVESRFQGVEPFVQALHKFGFRESWRDVSHDLFYFLDFVKERHVKHRNKLPALALRPCLYKRR